MADNNLLLRRAMRTRWVANRLRERDDYRDHVHCPAVKRILQNFLTPVLFFDRDGDAVEKAPIDFSDSDMFDFSQLQRSRWCSTVIEFPKQTFEFVPRDPRALSVDDEWIHKQSWYIMGLSVEQQFNLFGYTHNGDEIVNGFLRFSSSVENLYSGFLSSNRWTNRLDETYFPLFFPAMHVLRESQDKKQLLLVSGLSKEVKEEVLAVLQKVCSSGATNLDKYLTFCKPGVMTKLDYDKFWKPVLKRYAGNIQEIISGSPKVKHPFYVYRGSKIDYIGKDVQVFVARGFTSTSSNFTVASSFSDKKNSCCIHRILVSRGARVLFLDGTTRHEGESEFLLGDKAVLYIKHHKKTLHIQNMFVQDMILV